MWAAVKAFLRGLGEVLQAASYVWRKSQERKRIDKARAERDLVENDITGWYSEHFGVRRKRKGSD